MLSFISVGWVDWRLRPLRPVQSGWHYVAIVVVPMAVLVVGYSWPTDIGATFGMMQAAVVMSGLVTVMLLGYLSALLTRRREYWDNRVAQTMLPAGAEQYFSSDGFRYELAALDRGRVPTPGALSDIIGYWAYRAIQTGHYWDCAYASFYSTAILGWRVSSPALAAQLPALTGPFRCQDYRSWNPDVEHEFRSAAVGLLTARFDRPTTSADASPMRDQSIPVR